MAANPVPYLSAEAYLRFERAAESKHEYFDGRMWAMSGRSMAHSFLAAKMIAALTTRLAGKPFLPSTSDLRVRTSATGLYTYPDVTVVCGPIAADEEDDTLTNPTLIVEVLSKSTESYDRGLKFDLYRQIESFREYVLVSQESPRIETYFRMPDNRWAYSTYIGVEATCELESLSIAIPLSEIYENIALTAPVSGHPGMPV